VDSLYILIKSLIAGEYYLTVHFIDVGHGDCIFIETPDDGIDNDKYHGYKILIDAGYDYANSNYVIPYLNGLGMDQDDTIDYVIATHPHQDHIDEFPEIYDYFQVNNTLDPGYEYNSNCFREYKAKAESEPNSNFYFNLIDSGLIEEHGDYIDWGAELQVRILHSDPNPSKTNNASIVIHLTYQDVSFLFTGDAEGKKRDRSPDTVFQVEKDLVEAYGDDLQSTVLKVGHHGSETSSTFPFIRAVQPQYAVICAGRKSHSGVIHPDISVLQRYESEGAVILRTDRDDEDKVYSRAPGDDHIVIRTNGVIVKVNQQGVE